MADEEKKPEKGKGKPEEEPEEPKTGSASAEEEDIHDEDFQFALKGLLDAFRPILEEELERAQALDALKEEAQNRPPNCDDELTLANRIFEAFFTEEVAVRLLSPQAREVLGSVDRWRWCLLHIRCCMMFGWLVCRGPRNFRAFVYYLYRYWLCIRQVLGYPVVEGQLTAEERQDFQTLVQALATAYKPYLSGQVAAVDIPVNIPDEVLAGNIDCFEGQVDATAIFERLLAPETALALLGKAAFEEHSQEPFFWFCRCWCVCAIRFGCCLAQAHNFVEMLHCLRFYRRCLRACFRPIHCELTAPTGCAEEQPNQALSPESVGLEITGTAAGAFFSHYTLEWRLAEGKACEDDSWKTGEDYFAYPGGGSSGTAAVNNGLLGVLNTTFLSAGAYEIRLCVYSTTSNTPHCCKCIEFRLFKKMVWISQVADLPGAPVQTPPGPFIGNTPIVSGSPVPPGVIVPVGGPIHVKGAAFVGECNNRKIKCFDLRAAVGWHPGPEDPTFGAHLPLYTISMLDTAVCYDDPDPQVELRKRAEHNWRDVLDSMLTVFWKKSKIGSTEFWKLKPKAFASQAQLPLNVFAGSPPCPDPHHRCRSGKYTILLEVQDTIGNFYYDTQQVWFDNKPMINNRHVVFEAIEGLPGCTDLHLKADNSPFVPAGAPCNVAWWVNLLGIAYDEYIDETLPNSYPNNNFDFYRLTITRQGGPAWQIPITISPDPSEPTHGIQRRGHPGQVCEPVPAGGPGCPPAQMVPGKMVETLTALDMRAFDEVCVSQIMPATLQPPAGFALERGTCCGYTFRLYAQDKTWSNGWEGGFHHAWSLPWAVCICNDLPKEELA